MDNLKSLYIPKELWRKLILDLRLRGKGFRESGAFLLGSEDSRVVSKYICYDDLDPRSLDLGYILFESDSFIPLWEICKKDGLQVLSDIHTHPKKWTGQSELDRTNPSIPIAGHIALIVPVFAKKNVRTLNGVGIHHYSGNFNWINSDFNSNFVKLI